MRPDYNVTLGHEGVGYIESIGAEASDKGFKVGDAIGFNYFIGACFECEGCMIHNMRCETGNQKLQGFVSDGYFAEYAVVDWQNAVKLPENLDMSKTAPLFCAGITAFHSVDSCELKAGDWLAVIGCGGLGQYAIQYAKAVSLGRKLRYAWPLTVDRWVSRLSVSISTTTNSMWRRRSARKLSSTP